MLSIVASGKEVIPIVVPKAPCPAQLASSDIWVSPFLRFFSSMNVSECVTALV